MRKLILGCGYLGLRVAARWVADGDTVFAVTRSSERACEFQGKGVLPIVGDILDPHTLGDFPDVDIVLFAVGYDRRSGHSIGQVYVDGLQNVLQHLPRGIKRLIYVSSTGVYGQADHAWVDEQSPCEPSREGGRACRQAELLLQSHPLSQRVVILRMAGIYGPGRIPRQKELQAGLPITAASEGYLNLIHVDDAATTVIAAEKLACLPSLYCVSDGHPVVRREYFRELAALLGAADPTFRPPPAGSHAADRARTSKRVDSRRMLAELRVDLRYPSYREGLAAIAHASVPSKRK